MRPAAEPGPLPPTSSFHTRAGPGQGEAMLSLGGGRGPWTLVLPPLQMPGLPPELPTYAEVKVLPPCLGSVDQISKPRLWSFRAAEIATAWVRAAVTTAPTRRHPTPNAHTHTSMQPDRQNSSKNLLELPHLQTNRIQKLQPWVLRTIPEGEVGLLRN